MKELNGFANELTATNMDVKYHELWRNVKPQSQLWIKFEKDTNLLSIASNQILSIFEFKIFIYSYFLNRLRIDDMLKFKAFARICLSQLNQEMDELVLWGQEGIICLSGYFHRDEQYLREKFQYFMEDIEAFIEMRTFPKYTHVSILAKPLDHSEEVILGSQSVIDYPNFLSEYESILKVLSERYIHTPGVKTQDEKEQDALKFSNIPKGIASLDHNGIDGYTFGNSTGQIKSILGLPDTNPRYSGNIDQFFCYHKLGVSFGFKNNSLIIINIYSGRPEGWGETKSQKYIFRNNILFTMDSYYDDILKLFGAPIEEKEFPKAKIHFKSLDYGRFSFSFYTSNNQLYYFQYRSENFKL